MPRKSKGGNVEGKSQTAYSNRSDLNNRGPQPITAAPGEPYGQRKMLEDAQRNVPMGGTNVPSPTPANQNNLQTVPPPQPVEPGSIPWNEPATAPARENILPPQWNPATSHARLTDILEAAAAHPAASAQVRALADVARRSAI